jgi:uncharacterized protein YjaZ
MVVSEELAESFATSLYGEELLGPWVDKTDMETLNTVIKRKMKDQLHVTGLEQINPYLYGDDLPKTQNFTPVLSIKINLPLLSRCKSTFRNGKAALRHLWCVMQRF